MTLSNEDEEGVLELTSDTIAESLLSRNYFPSHAADESEMPPSINAEGFGTELLAEVAAADAQTKRPYECMAYGLTRFDLSVRTAGIPHPTAYARLVQAIRDNWDKMKHVGTNPHSALRPMLRKDGRLFSMGYTDPRSTDFSAEAAERFGRKFVVKTDIKNFFPSIYTHAIPWALIGKAEAKATAGQQTWYNDLDANYRRCQRNQTNGLPIGPGTSSVGAEILLHPVDTKLSEKGFGDFHRFIDDYTFYADSYDEGQRFIDELSALLREFELQINGAKTSIEMLPKVSRPRWLSQLVLARPKEISNKNELRAYLDLAIGLASEEVGGSVLKYAIKALVPEQQEPDTNDVLARLILNLSFHRPGLMPLLNHVFTFSNKGAAPYESELNDLAARAAVYGRSDAAAWAIHILLTAGCQVDNRVVDEILQRGDVVGLSLLHTNEVLSPAQIRTCISAVREAQKGALGTAWWLLEYVLGRSTHIKHRSQGLRLLSEADVSFTHRVLPNTDQ
ncbi:RNA-directed DNA polymerase [Pseudarthrobacter equi]|uniref:RNA-directed DNA polymerase n=1 Tax=Pseudarthrobacter equi TaxID=728066 RepID=UPI0028D27B1D|nr:RNA-directed DNA polymerase [Pseudarthrobacter equi]